MDVWPLGAFRFSDRAPFLEGTRSVAEASAENLQVCIALVPELRVGDWGELSGTKGTRDVVHTGWRLDLPGDALSSFSFSSFFICSFLPCCFCSSSLEERDGGWRSGGGGEDGFTVDCFDSSPVAQRSIVFGLRLLEVHAVDGAAVHGSRALPGGLRPGGVVRYVGTYGHRWRGICSLRLWGQWRGLGGGGRTLA